jgi:hypothetical protein
VRFPVSGSGIATIPSTWRLRRFVVVDVVPFVLGVGLLYALLVAAGTPGGGDPVGDGLGGRSASDVVVALAVVLAVAVAAAWLAGWLGRVLCGSAASPLARAVRAAHEEVTRRYGLDPTVAWPRLEPLAGRRVRAQVERRGDALEFAARCSATGWVVSLVAVSIPQWTAGPLLAWPPLLGVVGYLVAVRATAGYGRALLVAFDLHRFDLLTRLHLPLPADVATEREVNERLSRQWAGTADPELTYCHGPAGELTAVGAAGILDRVEGAVKGALTPQEPVGFRGVVEVTLQDAQPIGDRGDRLWQIPAGRRSRLEVALVVGSGLSTGDRRRPDDWENPSAAATEFLDVRGRSAPRVEVEVDIDAPFIDVSTPHHHLDLASDEDRGVGVTDLSVSQPGRYDLLVSLFSSGRLVQAVPIELLAV